MSGLRDFPDLPPVWALGFAAGQGVLAAVLPLVRLDPGWAVPAGWTTVALGFGLMVWSAWWFRRKRTTIEPRERPTALIVEGPYRINRNPIYTGMAVALIGIGFMLGALSAVLLALLYPFVIDRRFVRGEEAVLREAFGAEAEAYFAATRRW